MENILAILREELIRNSDERVKKSGERFFREPVNLYGIKSSTVARIAREHLRMIKDRNKTQIFRLCGELWQSGIMEESFVACSWSYSLHKSYELSDFDTFERWVFNYVTNWASCDTFCNHSVGTLVEMYPSLLAELKRWSRSENRWVKRASAVSLIIPAKKGMFPDDIFEIADLLHSDPDDMVQKGYGWLLKVTSQPYQDRVFSYVMHRKATMPRTALRYAIEKMPKELKARAMKK